MYRKKIATKLGDATIELSQIQTGRVSVFKLKATIDGNEKFFASTEIRTAYNVTPSSVAITNFEKSVAEKAEMEHYMENSPPPADLSELGFEEV